MKSKRSSLVIINFDDQSFATLFSALLLRAAVVASGYVAPLIGLMRLRLLLKELIHFIDVFWRASIHPKLLYNW